MDYEHSRQSTNNHFTHLIFLTTFCELVYMVNLEEINEALALTFPSFIFIRLINTCDYDYYEVKFILVMKRRDKQGRTVVSRQRIIAYDIDTLYKECCKAARRFMNKDTGQGR